MCESDCFEKEQKTNLRAKVLGWSRAHERRLCSKNVGEVNVGIPVGSFGHAQLFFQTLFQHPAAESMFWKALAPHAFEINFSKNPCWKGQHLSPSNFLPAPTQHPPTTKFRNVFARKIQQRKRIS